MALRGILLGRRLVPQKTSGSATSRQTRSSNSQKSLHKNPESLDTETSTIPVESGPSHTSSTPLATSVASRSASPKSISIDDDSDSSDSSSSSGNSKNNGSNGGSNQKGNNDKTSSSSSSGNNGGNSFGNTGSNSIGSSGSNSFGNSGSSNSDSNNDSGSNSSSENKFSGFPFDAISPCEMVSDNDGRLQYSGTWTLESKDPNGIYFTSHTTSSAGSQVSIAFNGTGVTVIGIVHASNATVLPAVASYQIDEDAPVMLPLPISTRDIPNQQFFESPNLPLTVHKLLINVTSNGSPYTLDSLSICSKSTNTISDVLAPVPLSSTRKDLPEIIAVVVGGVSVLLLLVFGAIILLRRKRRKTQAKRNVRSPIWSWLQRQTLFTSSESIMRNNPSNPSTVDPYDKLSAAEKARPESSKNSAPDFSDKADSNVLPSMPEAALRREPGSALSDRSSAVPRRKSDDSSWLLPVLSLDSESLSDKLEDKMSEMLPDSAQPESYMSLPPHPPLVVKRGLI